MASGDIIRIGGGGFDITEYEEFQLGKSEYSSGTLGVWEEVVSIAGEGYLAFVAFLAPSPSSYTTGAMRVTLDGNVIFQGGMHENSNNSLYNACYLAWAPTIKHTAQDRSFGDFSPYQPANAVNVVVSSPVRTHPFIADLSDLNSNEGQGSVVTVAPLTFKTTLKIEFRGQSGGQYRVNWVGGVL